MSFTSSAARAERGSTGGAGRRSLWTRASVEPDRCMEGLESKLERRGSLHLGTTRAPQAPCSHGRGPASPGSPRINSTPSGPVHLAPGWPRRQAAGSAALPEAESRTREKDAVGPEIRVTAPERRVTAPECRVDGPAIRIDGSEVRVIGSAIRVVGQERSSRVD